MIYKIGSRGSDLALWQARYVREELRKINIQSEIKIIKTQGDIITDLSFDKMEGKGFFTKEIELALQNKEIDLAVHSHKDLETTSPSELTISAVSYRENPSEILIMNPNAWDNSAIWELKQGSIIGTSSARRKSQIISLRPDLEIKNLRGNVPTRINKLRSGEYDAILLAYAGIKRLQVDLSNLNVIILDPEEFVPAPAQGVMAIQSRIGDVDLNRILSQITNKKVEENINLERKILKEMNGGCQIPLGVYNDGEYIHVSYAEKEDAPSRYFRFRCSDNSGLIELICRKIKPFSTSE